MIHTVEHLLIQQPSQARRYQTILHLTVRVLCLQYILKTNKKQEALSLKSQVDFRAIQWPH
jgi:hypothetical protein